MHFSFRFLSISCNFSISLTLQQITSILFLTLTYIFFNKSSQNLISDFTTLLSLENIHDSGKNLCLDIVIVMGVRKSFFSFSSQKVGFKCWQKWSTYSWSQEMAQRDYNSSFGSWTKYKWEIGLNTPHLKLFNKKNWVMKFEALKQQI